MRANGQEATRRLYLVGESEGSVRNADGRDLRSDDSLLEPFSPRRFLSGCLADKLREKSRYKCTIVKIKPTSMLLSRDSG